MQLLTKHDMEAELKKKWPDLDPVIFEWVDGEYTIALPHFATAAQELELRQYITGSYPTLNYKLEVAPF